MKKLTNTPHDKIFRLNLNNIEDVLVVWKLDRLARSLKQLIEAVEKLEIQKIGLLSLTEAINTTTS